MKQLKLSPRVLAASAGMFLVAAVSGFGAAAWADDPAPSPTATTSADLSVTCDTYSGDADGSYVYKCSDGSSTTYYSDGSSVSDNGAGCIVKTDADGNSVSDGPCPDPTPIDFGSDSGCSTQVDDQGNPVLDDQGNPVVVCAEAACSSDADTACPLMYSTGLSDGRDNCPMCRTLSGSAEQSQSAVNNDAVLDKAAVAFDKAKTAADKSAAIEMASANQPAVSLGASGSTKGAGPAAPITLTVIGGGFVAAGLGVWRYLARSAA